MKVKTPIPRTLTKGGQSVMYRELCTTAGGDKLRIDIKSDAYRAQSHARIERWDGEQWQLVWSIAPDAMATREGLYVRTFSDADFTADRATLIKHAAVILGRDAA